MPTPCQAGRGMGLPREAGATGEEQGGDAWCALLAVPKQLLEEVGPDTSDPFLLSDYMHGNVGERRLHHKQCGTVSVLR